MKTIQFLIASAALAFGMPSFASSFNINCSNPEGTIRTISGHTANQVILTVRDYSADKVQSKEIIFDLRDMSSTALKSTAVHEKSSESCKSGQVGMYSYQSLTYQQVRFELRDGSVLPEGISDARLSEDGKNIEVHMLCEKFISGMKPCP